MHIAPEFMPYYFPETEAMVNDLARRYPHDLFRGFSHRQHEIGDAIKAWYTFGGLPNFEYIQLAPGITEALRHLLWAAISYSPSVKIYMLEGDRSEYWQAGVGLPPELSNPAHSSVTRIDPAADFAALEHGLVVLSNPSFRDGCFVQGDRWQSILSNHRVICDITGIGLVRRERVVSLNLNHPNILTAVSDLAGSFGLIGYNLAVTFSREAVVSLNQAPPTWSTFLARQALERFPAGYWFSQYKSLQTEAIEYCQSVLDAPGAIQSGDMLLLAYADYQPEERHWQPMAAGDGKYRFGLAPYFMRRRG